MSISVFDLFTIGVGPSSSHTVGPMRAGFHFSKHIAEPQKVTRVQVELFGSLAFTGIGHGTDRAILAGIEGEEPGTVDTEKFLRRVDEIRGGSPLLLAGAHSIAFDMRKDMDFNTRELLPLHSNGMRLTAYGADGSAITSLVYYSIGGGFIIDGEGQPLGNTAIAGTLPYPFKSMAELGAHVRATGKSIRDIMWENEKAWRSENEIRWQLLEIWRVMQECIEAGLEHEGTLPGGLDVKRRAAKLHRKLLDQQQGENPPGKMDWLNPYAIAVNEENAAGGRVVTAPTNGAAGILPAVLYYYTKHTKKPTEEGIITYLLTSGAIGMLYKHGASISAAEVGCQGEVGVASSMAAGALVAAMDGTIEQIENAAEMAMEHNLGLTCDPIGGLVQIPCIERNAIGAVKAVNCARLALNEEGTNKISLDSVIATMLATGKDMMSKYKETSEGGLAVRGLGVNVPEC